MNVSAITNLDKASYFYLSGQQEQNQNQNQNHLQQQDEHHIANTSPCPNCGTHILTPNATKSTTTISAGRIQKDTCGGLSQLGLPSLRKSGDIVLTPSKDDVLFGRGIRINKHPGNKHFRLIVDSMKARYQELKSKIKKKKISQDVLSIIHSYGGRFLMTERNAETREPYWVVVGYEDARLKASQALREKNKR